MGCGARTEFGLMRGTENIIGTRSRRPRRAFHVTRVHLTMKWVSYFSTEMLAPGRRRSWQGQFSGQLGMRFPARVTLSLYFFQETRDKKKLCCLVVEAARLPRPAAGGRHGGRRRDAD